MKDEIVSRLMRNRKKIEFLNESHLYEKEDEDDIDFDEAPGADEDYKALTGEDEENHDDSQAPIQGKPDDPEPEEQDIEDTAENPEPPVQGSHAGGKIPSPQGDEDVEPEEPPVPDEPKPEESGGDKVYENPLDNEYAVHFTLGDEVNLIANGTKNSDVKKGIIEGYDAEGFYKVKWSDESTTNGLTDIALESLIKKVKESKCICGCTEFVEEEGHTLCDRCGRIYENALDALTIADKSRPKGKRMIRSEAHPVSTANRPNISVAEAIRKAFKGTSIREEDDPNIKGDSFDRLKELGNEFWTRTEEMKKDIEDLGFTIEEIDNEKVVVSSEDDEENVYLIPIISTSRSMTLEINKAKMI